MHALPQPVRLFILLVYAAGLIIASKIALGAWLPPTSSKGLWFYSGLANILLGNLLITPFFTKPVDAIAYAVAALLSMLSVRSSALQDDLAQLLWGVPTTYAIAVLLLAFSAIALKDVAERLPQKLSQSFLLMATILGAPTAVFSAVYLFAILAFHRNSPQEYLTLSVTWALLIGLRPLEALAGLVQRATAIWGTQKPPVIGHVIAQHIPGIILIRHEQTPPLGFGELLVAHTHERPAIALTLDYVGLGEERWLRAMTLNPLPDTLELPTYPATTVTTALTDLTPAVADNPVWNQRHDLIGFAAPDSDITTLRVELVRTDRNLQEGLLLQAQIGPQPVLYQIVNGLTQEEIVQQKNTRGYIRADAKKIGWWNTAASRFEQVQWIPQPNTPVFLVTPQSANPTRDAAGHLPRTDYAISINPNLLVTHHTAILGILGAGKSYLAFELVERFISAGIKVVCLDLTNQYANELAAFHNREADEQAAQELQAIGAAGASKYERDVEAGGSVRQFKAKINDILTAFLGPSSTQQLRIINPAQFTVWRQDSRVYPDGKAAMATLTPAEITRTISEAALEVLQQQGMTDRARCCIVYEEAHSLIPEFTAIAAEGDKAAVNGTAKAILQGRKYGLGCIVITQRTANVTKSILNQCNTIFALRIYDATGMEFLRNYIGPDYAKVLSTLEDRHAVVFGRASSCNDPVLVRLNDRKDFLATFRPQTTTATPPAGSAAAGSSNE